MAQEMGVLTVRISQRFKGAFFHREELLIKGIKLGVTVDLMNIS